KRWIIMGLNK
nr:Chain C, Gag protein [Human immunodeficiency virus 1]4G9F_C Chain C, Gag protein [Human immunodeficiency virus 1]